MKKLLVVAFIGAIFATPAYATISCSGQVTQIDMEPNGDTYVSWGSWRTRICNPGQSVAVNRGPVNGGTTITPAGCSALISLFLTAKTTGKPVAVFVERDACTFVEDYSDRYPYFFKFL